MASASEAVWAKLTATPFEQIRSVSVPMNLESSPMSRTFSFTLSEIPLNEYVSTNDAANGEPSVINI